MKLKKLEKEGVQLIQVSEPVTLADSKILHAGIKSLFTNGKNKIVLELVGQQALPAEVLREIAFLDVLARELAGRIVLAGVDPELKTRIEAFAKPPVVKCFATVEEALETFKPKPPKPIPAAPSPAPAPAPAAAPAGQFKEDIRKRELEDVGTFRRRIAELEKENLALRKQLVAAMAQRRVPQDAATFQEKIRSLEAQLQQCFTELQSKPADKGAPPAKSGK